MKETALGLLYPEAGDSFHPREVLENHAKKVSERLQQGGVGAHLYVPGEKTRASTSYGSFSTPIKVELPEVKINQMLQIYIAGYAKQNSGVVEGGSLAIAVDGVVQTLAGAGGGIYYSEAWQPVWSRGYLAISGFAITPTTPQDKLSWGNVEPFSSISPITFISATDRKPCVIELYGKANSGATVTVDNVYLAAHVIA